MWVAILILAAIWSWTGMLAERYPETLSGYDMMSPERKRCVDIRGLGRFCARLLYVCCGITLAGLPAAILGYERWVLAVLLAPIPVLIVGALWGAWRYDALFLKLFRR